jgi:hypothetical protein
MRGIFSSCPTALASLSGTRPEAWGGPIPPGVWLPDDSR